MEQKNGSLFKSIDWWTIAIYIALVVFGWFSICGASYTYGEVNFFDFDVRSGKQAVWICCSLGLGFVLLMLEEKLYEMFAYILYGAMLVLLFLTPFVAEDTKGSLSWIKLGPVSLQPAEFAKFATALALAKYMGTYGFSMEKMKQFATVVSMVLFPMLLIIMQKETGSALVYLAFFLMLYREGMSGVFLFSGLCAVVYFVVGIRFSETPLTEIIPSSVGSFVVLLLILLVTVGMMMAYSSKREPVRNVLVFGLGTTLLGFLFAQFVIPFRLMWLQLAVCVVLVGYLSYLALAERCRNYALIALFTFCSALFFFSTDIVFNQVLQPHQQVRIKVSLGMTEDLAKAGYNVNQSKIAIGSGGLLGKGFLNGTQTKLKYVPEQDTDFIFCTVGEEEGFVGSAAVLLLFMALILRLIYLSERQPRAFGRVYGYSVASIFFFHLFINVGMVTGLTPVIGIPLPFFSYGGSSLWGFTLLLFIFLRIDATRGRV
jgi:rod shape determining protein RodA